MAVVGHDRGASYGRICDFHRTERAADVLACELRSNDSMKSAAIHYQRGRHIAALIFYVRRPS